jgi:uncharacterized repeat protein (TIGR03803 family)
MYEEGCMKLMRCGDSWIGNGSSQSRGDTFGRALRRWSQRLGRRAGFAAAGLAIALLLGAIATRPAEAQTYTFTTLHDFDGSDGATPEGNLISDSEGNLYGTTYFGGSSNCSSGCGTVFELVNSSGSYTEKLLYSFRGGGDGQYPYAGLIKDSSGNLYGTTQGGGSLNAGTVFELVNSSGSYTENVLYSFTGGGDGGYPASGLIMDSSGNLYGTTF